MVDAAHPEAEAQIVAVQEVLEDIGAQDRPQLLVLNKIDAAERASVEALARRIESELGTRPVLASAVSGEGIEDLVQRVVASLPTQRYRVTGHVPYARQDLVAMAHRQGNVVAEEHTDSGTLLTADVDEEAALELRAYLDEDPFAEPPESWER